MTSMSVPVVPRPPDGRRLAAVMVVAAVALALACLAIWIVQDDMRGSASRAEMATSFERRLSLARLATRMEQAESSQRGYVLAGDAALLATYRSARLAAHADLTRFETASSGQRALLGRARQLVDRRFAEMERVISIHDAGGRTVSTTRTGEASGSDVMQAFHRTIAEMSRVEEADARRRMTVADSDRTRARRTAAVVGAAGLAALAIVLMLLSRRRRRRYLAERLAHDAAGRDHTILDSMIDPIVIVDPDGTIARLNAAATRSFGYREDELVSRDITTILDLPGAGGTFHERIGLRDGRIATPYLPDLTIRHRDGQAIAVDVALGVMRLPDGDHIVASVRDIAERKRVEAAKDELLSTISHELRTPLTSVVGALGLLRAGSAGDLPAPASRLIEIAESNARRLIRLINDMLDIDRMRSGQLRIDVRPIDLNEVAVSAHETSLGLGESHGVAIRFECHDAPLPVSADSDRLQQVIVNLLSNAIRVSTPGSTLTLRTVFERGAGKAVLQVDDEGPGVPAEFRDRIFGRFERATSAKGVGTGLGLAISREIIQRHAGRIWFEDRPGGGSRFAFTLDLVEPDPAQAAGHDLADEDALARASHAAMPPEPQRILSQGRRERR